MRCENRCIICISGRNLGWALLALVKLHIVNAEVHISFQLDSLIEVQGKGGETATGHLQRWAGLLN